uniref:RxLR effector candidate protein n=1 Tax=Hyaloperonospora arabidopsidis (strain Emoy2) TaxID=559515 RepID=M4B3E2_HYAAE
MFVSLWRRTSLAVSRGFSTAALKQPVSVATSINHHRVYYDRIARKFPTKKKLSVIQSIDRATQYLEGRGLSRTQALRAISQHVMLMNYSEELMESKIPWFEGIGLSHDKINAIIMRHPNILGISIDKYEALIKWYLSHGVAQDKIAYLFNIFPQGVSYNIQDNLDPKVELLKEIGCSDQQVTRALTRSPQIFTLSVERLRGKADYLVELGVPRERLPHIVSSVPECLALTLSRLKETVDALDEMFGAGAGLRALLYNCRIVMSNINAMRESFDFFISIGFTKERLEKNTRFIMRSVNRCLRPRVEFLKTKSVDVVSDITWILMPEALFVQKYPDYTAFEMELNTDFKKK